jgi:hypothetical protein
MTYEARIRPGLAPGDVMGSDGEHAVYDLSKGQTSALTCEKKADGSEFVKSGPARSFFTMGSFVVQSAATLVKV